MKITEINAQFPKINIGNHVEALDCFQQKVSGKVVATWYPKYNDEWNETEEYKHMGLYGSEPNAPFPQIAINTQKGTLVLFGDDVEDIISINKEVPMQ